MQSLLLRQHRKIAWRPDRRFSPAYAGPSLDQRAKQRADLSDPSDIFVPVTFAEPQVLVQSKPDVVTIQAICELFEVKQMLFERTCYGRLIFRGM